MGCGGSSHRYKSHCENTKGYNASDYSSFVTNGRNKKELYKKFKASNADESDNLADIINYAFDDDEGFYKTLKSGKFSNRYARNTNSTGVNWQRGCRCYAYAACSAYINTIMRIYGARPPPTFKECYEIACYNEGYGGSPEKSIRLLEKHFHYGVCCCEAKPDECSIRDALTISLIVTFSTSKKGWENVANGKLINYPGGESDGMHACVVDGYDFDSLSLICKNFWGEKTAKARFLLNPSATHYCSIIKVYFETRQLGDIYIPVSDYIKKILYPSLKKFKGTYKGRSIDCAWMNEETAIYTPVYLCEYRGEKDDGYNYLGYDTEQWININITSKYYSRSTYISDGYRFNIKGYKMKSE